MEKIEVKTSQRSQILDITSQVQACLSQQTKKSGMLLVFCPHTTAGLTVNENADPSVKSDMGGFLGRLVPRDPAFTHAEGNADSHIKGSLLGCSQTFIVERGGLQLGTWQGIYFMEFDGPRQREVWLQFVPKD